MLKVLNKMTIFIVLASLAALLTIPAAAMDFSVSAVLPGNQRPNGSAFFDLLVHPGQEQDLIVEISNTRSTDIVVLVETITASTSRNGQINYTASGKMDDSLEHSFEDIVAMPQSYYDIPAKTTIQVPISLTVPDAPFSGAILGSIRVLREATQEEKDAAGAIVNQYAHVTAVRLVQSENAEEIPADFALGEINVELVNYRASIIANVSNTQPIIIKGATASAVIYPKGSDQAIFEDSIESLDFAPNSVFPYSFVDREGYGIDAGDYTVAINIGYDGRDWNFRQDFTIDPKTADEVNEGAVNQHGQVRPEAEGIAPAETPAWVYIMIAIGGAVLTALIALVIMVARRKPALVA